MVQCTPAVTIVDRGRGMTSINASLAVSGVAAGVLFWAVVGRATEPVRPATATA
jgi:hypothetical protein